MAASASASTKSSHISPAVIICAAIWTHVSRGIFPYKANSSSPPLVSTISSRGGSPTVLHLNLWELPQSPPPLFVASVARFFFVVFFSLLFVSSVVVVVPQSESASFDFVASARADVLPRWIPVRLGRDRNSQVQSGDLRIT